MNEARNISVIGLGKLGLCAAACFASKGFNVIGVDVDRDKIEAINKGDNPVRETGLTELIKICGRKLRTTHDYREAILNSEVTFVVVATPSEADGSFSNEQIEEALKNIGLALKYKEGRHLVVITSTVMPGTTEHVGKFILEETSGKRCGRDFGLAYNPEFIALGSVIHDFLNPDYILIGEVNKEDGDILQNIYNNICENKPRFARMNPVSAEIAKIAMNCYITMKITYANSLAAVCEKVANADAEIITRAIGLDSRIGSKYLKPGLGFGGPCFPRDNAAFAAFARKVNEKAKLTETIQEVNEDQVIRIKNIVEELVSKTGKDKKYITIGVLGLSYKPNTPIIEDSQAVDIVELLANDGHNIIVYDPQAIEIARGVFGNEVRYANDSRACAREADVLIITTPWDEFKDIAARDVKKDAYILDCWGILKDKNLKLNIIYLGKGQSTVREMSTAEV